MSKACIEFGSCLNMPRSAQKEYDKLFRTSDEIIEEDRRKRELQKANSNSTEMKLREEIEKLKNENEYLKRQLSNHSNLSVRSLTDALSTV